MNAVLDTHRIVKRLVGAGFSAEQAETVTDVVLETRELDIATLATKADLAELRAELKAEIKLEISGVRSEIAAVRVEIATLKSDLLRWVIGLMVAQTGLIVAVGRLLH